MNAGTIGLWVGLLGTVVAVISVLFMHVRDAEKRDDLEALLAQGQRLSGVLAQVDAIPTLDGHPRRVSAGRQAVFVFEPPKGPVRVETGVFVPLIAMHLFQAGARCEAIVDTKDPSRLCVVSLHDHFGNAETVKMPSYRFGQGARSVPTPTPHRVRRTSGVLQSASP
ncbi:hypothetical protein [Myxococcus qinghaiensis]|uniref:hypothetical protein n=1 Tax=Myxococcus qinghaiensis TaxID=2906758 RepID=UPI0020A83886|nr:hypothetical protein [Myxococcus qinghaiensis]MCP3162526.1 hypothetical protein [Myxococcus qinghaiensis]